MNVSYGTIVFPEPRSLLSGNSMMSFGLPGGKRLPSPFTDPRGAVNWIDLSPDRSRVVSIDSRGFVSMVRLEDDRELMRVRSHHDHGRAIAYSPDGRWIASGAEDILLWNASTQAPVQRLTHHAIVWNLVFTPDGRRLVSTHGDGAVLVWNLDERRLEANLGGHSGPVRAVAFSPDGTRLASAGDDRTVALWDLSQSRKTKVLAGQPTRVNALAFSPDGQWLVSCDQEGRAVLWDVPRAVRLSAVAEATGSGRPCYGVAVSPDGHRWAAGERLWSAEGTLLDELPGMSAYPVRFSPDGRWLVRAGDQGEVEVRSAGGAVAGFLPGAGPPGIEGLAVAPDSATFAVGTGTGEVRLYRLDPLSLLAVLGRHEARVRSIAISPDGRRLASAGDDGVIALWDPRRRRRAGVIARASSPVLAVAFSPDGRRLAAGLHDGSVRLYTVERSVWGVELSASEERP